MIEVEEHTSQSVIVNKHGRVLKFMFNPETQYVLVPEGIHKTETDLVEALERAEFVEGVFSHKHISEVK